MNILFANSAAYFGGGEHWISMAAAELERRGHSVWISCPYFPDAQRFAPHDRLFRQGPVSRQDTDGKNRLINFCREQSIEIFVTATQRLLLTYAKVARELGIGNVARLGIVRFPLRPSHWYAYRMLTDAIIVNSRQIKQVLSWVPFVQPNKILVIYNGVVEKQAVPIATDPGIFTITSVGKMSARKGMGNLIDALALMPESERARVRLILVGDGPELDQYRALAARTGLAKQIEFTGNVGDPSPYVSGSDLFVLLSAREGISNALLEAMSAGIPVYTTMVGGHGDFLVDGDNGYVAHTRNPVQVAADIRRIAGDENRASIAQAGRETARRLFSLSRMGDQLEELLISVAHRHSK